MGASRVLVVGSGAREHALAAALSACGAEVVVAPGNGGTALVARATSRWPPTTSRGSVALALDESVRLVVVGPELPLTLGLVDALEARGSAPSGPAGGPPSSRGRRPS